MALARATGRDLREVFDVIGDLPFARSYWWKVHAERLGLQVEEGIPIKNGYAARVLRDRLRAGVYLIDSTDHLECVRLPGQRIPGRWKNGGMVAYRVRGGDE